jgi:hypothetical protein
MDKHSRSQQQIECISELDSENEISYIMGAADQVFIKDEVKSLPSEAISEI